MAQYNEEDIKKATQNEVSDADNCAADDGINGTLTTDEWALAVLYIPSAVKEGEVCAYASRSTHRRPFCPTDPGFLHDMYEAGMDWTINFVRTLTPEELTRFLNCARRLAEDRVRAGGDAPSDAEIYELRDAVEEKRGKKTHIGAEVFALFNDLPHRKARKKERFYGVELDSVLGQETVESAWDQEIRDEQTVYDLREKEQKLNELRWLIPRLLNLDGLDIEKGHRPLAAEIVRKALFDSRHISDGLSESKRGKVNRKKLGDKLNEWVREETKAISGREDGLSLKELVKYLKKIKFDMESFLNPEAPDAEAEE